jgi:hypothetical protein
MSKPVRKAQKKTTSPRTDSKKVKRPAARARVPRSKPTKAVAASAVRKVTLSERRGLVLAALEAAQTQHWGLAPVTSSTVGGVEVRVVAMSRPRPFWWLRSHGLSSSVPAEVALRVPRAPGETQPPAWSFPVLERLITFAREDELEPGQIVRWSKPFGEAAETDLDAFAVAVDPSFGTIKTTWDTVPVLLAVGVTNDEVRLVREWSPEGLLEVLAKLDPTLCTTLDRASLLASPRARQAIEQRVEREGSSMGVLQARTCEGVVNRSSLTWKVDTGTADAIISLLKGRVGHQRAFIVRAPGFELEVQPGESPQLTFDRSRATLKLTQTMARNVRATLKARPGTYAWEGLPSLSLEVVA